jgi:hypothetical protein
VFVVIVLVVLVAALSGLVSFWLMIRFLRHVYDEGGPSDLVVAASALRTARERGIRGRPAQRRETTTVRPPSPTDSS